MAKQRDLSADARDFKRLFDDMKAVDKKLATATRKGLRTGAKPGVDAAKRSIRNYPDTSPATSGLRAAIESAIVVKVLSGKTRAGVFIVVNGSKLPAQYKAMPRALNKKKGFRHPVFGTGRWVVQKTKPWFHVAIEKTAPQVEKAVLAEIDRATKALKFR